jgi:hypothetical protein
MPVFIGLLRILHAEALNISDFQLLKNKTKGRAFNPAF